MRTLLTTLAIVLGVGMVSAAFTLTDTMRGAADSLSSAAYDGTDAVVTKRTAFAVDSKRLHDPAAQRSTRRCSTTSARCRRSAAAVGDISDQAQIIGRNGKPVGDGPYFGVGFDSKAQGAEQAHARSASRPAAGRPGRARSSSTPPRPRTSATRSATACGSPPAARPARSRVVGVARFGTVKSLGTATAAVFDLETAQQLFDKQGRYDSILVGGAPGVPAADVRAAVAAKVGDGAQVQTAAAHDRFTLDGLKQFIGIIKTVLLVFGGVAILVGAFTIFNTLSITVAQRTREFAMLRMVGAARRQVLGSVMIEALALGLGASIIGIGAGFGIAAGLNAMFGALDLSLPEAGTVFEARTAIVGLLVGTLVTLIAGFRPARKATKIAPVAALRDADPAAAQAAASGARGARRGVAARPARGRDRRLGRPARAPQRDAHPGRTAVTASALMIGVMLVTAVTVVANGLRHETKGTLNDRIAASHVITAQDGWSPIEPGGRAQAAAKVPGVTAVSALRQDGGLVAGQKEIVNGVDAATIAKVFDFRWKDGSSAMLSRARGDGAVVDEGWATAHGLKVGDRSRSPRRRASSSR